MDKKDKLSDLSTWCAKLIAGLVKDARLEKYYHVGCFWLRCSIIVFRFVDLVVGLMMFLFG